MSTSGESKKKSCKSQNENIFQGVFRVAPELKLAGWLKNEKPA